MEWIIINTRLDIILTHSPAACDLYTSGKSNIKIAIASVEWKQVLTKCNPSKQSFCKVEFKPGSTPRLSTHNTLKHLTTLVYSSSCVCSQTNQCISFSFFLLPNHLSLSLWVFPNPLKQSVHFRCCHVSKTMRGMSPKNKNIYLFFPSSMVVKEISCFASACLLEFSTIMPQRKADSSLSQWRKRTQHSSSNTVLKEGVYIISVSNDTWVGQNNRNIYHLYCNSIEGKTLASTTEFV